MIFYIIDNFSYHISYKALQKKRELHFFDLMDSYKSNFDNQAINRINLILQQSKRSSPNEMTEELKNLIDEEIRRILESEKNKNYKYIKKSLKNVITKVLAQNHPNLSAIFGQYQFAEFLIRLLKCEENENLIPSSLHCISNLIPINPDLYRKIFFNEPGFLEYIVNEFNTDESINRYSCISILYNLINMDDQIFLTNFLLSHLNLEKLLSFSLSSPDCTIRSLEFMEKMVHVLNLQEKDLLELIQLASIILNFIKGDLSNREKTLQHLIIFCCNVVSKQFMMIKNVMNLFSRILEFIADDNTALVLFSITFYNIVSHLGIKNKEYAIVKEVIEEAPLSLLIDWIKELNPFKCDAGYKLLEILLLFQNELEMNVLDEINHSFILAAAMLNIKECRFEQKPNLFRFIKAFIEISDVQNILEYSHLFFDLFDYLINQDFDNRYLFEILSSFRVFLSKLHLVNEYKEIIEKEECKYDFIKHLHSLKFQEDFNDINVIGQINIICNMITPGDPNAVD